jgi:hypothetical protein
MPQAEPFWGALPDFAKTTSLISVARQVPPDRP